jgi:hypothetical protein
VTVETPVPSTPSTLNALHGRTFAVQVDSADLQKVRVDFSQLMPQAGSFGLPGPTTGGMSYAARPPFNEPQPPPRLLYGMQPDDLSPGLRMYLKLVRGIGYLAAAVVVIGFVLGVIYYFFMR